MNKAITMPLAVPVADLKARGLIIIPARDEAGTVGDVVREVKEVSDCDIVVIDDCSTDGTSDAARNSGATVLRLPIWLGAWGAVQTGLRYALDAGYDTAVSMDADGQHRAESLGAVIVSVTTRESDVAIGVCPDRASLPRRFIWSILRHMTGLATLDITSGLRAYNTRAMRLLTSEPAAMLNYQDIGVLLMLRAQGLCVTEVGVEMEPRRSGHSRVYADWGAVVAYLMETFMFSAGKWRPSWHLRNTGAAGRIRRKA